MNLVPVDGLALGLLLQYHRVTLIGPENWTNPIFVFILFFTLSVEVPITQCSAAKEEIQTHNSIVFFLPVCLSLFSFFLSPWQSGVPAGTDN